MQVRKQQLEPDMEQDRFQIGKCQYFERITPGEGNGNPLQYSCLENPRDDGSWWVAIYGVAQSQTRLKRLSIGSSKKQEGSNIYFCFTDYAKAFDCVDHNKLENS